MRLRPLFFLLAMVALAAGTFVFFKLTAFPEREGDYLDLVVEAPEPAAMTAPLVTFLDPELGPKDAPHLIVEYGDYVCPYCREADEAVRALLEANPGKIRFVWKDAPNSLHFGADIAAEAAHCAKAQGKFWEYHDRLFREGGLFDTLRLGLVARDLGLVEEDFNRCITGRETKAFVERSAAEARALGIRGTPAFYIDGVPYEGQLTYEQLAEAIRD